MSNPRGKEELETRLMCFGARYGGVSGAQNIVNDLNDCHNELTISAALGKAEIEILVDGLLARRSDKCGLGDLCIRECGIADAGLEAIMGYVAEDPKMRTLIMTANYIEVSLPIFLIDEADTKLRSHVNSIIHSINTSHLTSLNLSRNPNLLSSGVEAIFNGLDSPRLSYLELDSCGLGPGPAKAIAGYLASRRSLSLVLLSLSGNRFGLEGTREIIDALDSSNFSLQNLNLESTTPGICTPVQQHQIQMQTRRIPPLLERNEGLTERTELAALRYLLAARILLNALRPTPSAPPAHSTKASTADHIHPPSYFRFLDLPLEIQDHIARHASGDANALSHAQITRLRQMALRRESPAPLEQSGPASARLADVPVADAENDHADELDCGDGEELCEKWAFLLRAVAFMRAEGFDRWESDL